MSDQPPALAQAKEFLERGEYGKAADAYERASAEGDAGSELLTGWAKALAAIGRFDLANEKLDAALELDPPSGDAYLTKARLLLAQQRPDDALALFEQATTIVGDHAPLYVGLGELLAQRGLNEQARWRFERAIAIDGDHVPAHLGLGHVFLQLGFAEEAAEQFGQVAERLDGGNGAAYAGWGRALQRLGDFEGAAGKLRQAIELEADSPIVLDLWRETGQALYEEGRFSEALDAHEEAIASERQFPSDPSQKYQARYGSAQAALAANQPEKALERCKDGLDLLRQLDLEGSEAAASLHYVTGAAQTLVKLYPDAVASFKRASTASPTFAVYSLNAVATTLAWQGKYEEGWGVMRQLDAAIERVEAQQPPTLDDGQLSSIGTALLWLDRLDEAEEHFKRALGPDGGNANAWMKLTAVYLERREQSVEKASHWQWEAYGAYRKAISLLEAQCKDKRSAEPVIALGLLHLQMDDLGEAERRLEEGVELDGEAVMAIAGLGVVRVRRREHGKAIELLERALRRDPDNLVFRCHLADAYLRLKRPGVAHETYEEVLRNAPNNVGALIGTGEVLIGQAEKTKDDRLYEQAELSFLEAIELARSVRQGSPDRRGSSGLGVRQWADLHYSLGYVRVKLYEAKMGSGVARLTKAGRGHLENALEDFEESRRTGVNPHRAESAAERVRAGLERFSPMALSEKYATTVVVAITLALLFGVQLAFFGSGGFSRDEDPVSYVTLTLSLLVLLAAGFYLPQILKLRFGGIELEKSAGEQPGGFALDVHREPFQARLHAMLDPPVLHGTTVEHDGGRIRTKRRSEANKGVHASKDVRGSGADAEQGVDESAE